MEPLSYWIFKGSTRTRFDSRYLASLVFKTCCPWAIGFIDRFRADAFQDKGSD